MVNKNDLLNELINKQKKDVYYSNKLSYRDLNRIIKYIDTSIFGKKCCIWNGYISTSLNEKSYYINFFFKTKKISLQKLLYQNYIGKINKKEYIKYTCKNAGKCCNINHIIKHIPVHDLKEKNNENNDIDSDSDETTDILIESESESESKTEFIVTF